MKNTNQSPSSVAKKAVQLIKMYSPTVIGTRPNLYKNCLAGIEILQRLKAQGPKDISSDGGSLEYNSLTGQRAAGLFAQATLDNALTVLIEETSDHKWRWDLVTDIPGLIVGSPETEPCSSRDEAEAVVLGCLRSFGMQQKPGPEYQPTPDLDTKIQIRVNKEPFIVQLLPDHLVDIQIEPILRTLHWSKEQLMAYFAKRLLIGDTGEHEKAFFLTLLANSEWTHITEEVLTNFCQANGVIKDLLPTGNATPIAA